MTKSDLLRIVPPDSRPGLFQLLTSAAERTEPLSIPADPIEVEMANLIIRINCDAGLLLLLGAARDGALPPQPQQDPLS
jgi:hypothetical protein